MNAVRVFVVSLVAVIADAFFEHDELWEVVVERVRQQVSERLGCLDGVDQCLGMARRERLAGRVRVEPTSPLVGHFLQLVRIRAELVEMQMSTPGDARLQELHDCVNGAVSTLLRSPSDLGHPAVVPTGTPPGTRNGWSAPKECGLGHVAPN